MFNNELIHSIEQQMSETRQHYSAVIKDDTTPYKTFLEEVVGSNLKITQYKIDFKEMKKAKDNNLYSKYSVDCPNYPPVYLLNDGEKIFIDIPMKAPENLNLVDNVFFDISGFENFGMVFNLYFGKNKCAKFTGSDINKILNSEIILNYNKGSRKKAFRFNLRDFKSHIAKITDFFAATDCLGTYHNDTLALLNSHNKYEFLEYIPPVSAKDFILRVQYAKSFTHRLDSFRSFLADQKIPIQDFQVILFQTKNNELQELKKFFRLLGSHAITPNFTKLLDGIFSLDFRDLWLEIHHDKYRSLIGDMSFWAFLQQSSITILSLVLCAPQRTNYGKKLCTMKFSESFVSAYEINTEDYKNTENFWTLCSDITMRNFDLAVLTGGAPMLNRDLYNNFQNEFKLSPSVDELHQTIDDLWQEAQAGRQGLIPVGAFIKFAVGDFVGVELYEAEDNIFCKWKTDSNHFLFGVLPIKAHAGQKRISPTFCQFGLEDNYFMEQEDEDLKKIEQNIEKILANLAIISASMIRDFWVIEERQSLFQSIAPDRLPKSLRKNLATSKYIYLPRVRYIKNFDHQKIANNLNLTERSQHLVRQHFRKVDPSAKQRLVCQMLDLELPEGHTLIKSHYRGNQDIHRVYKSRSALESYCQLVDLAAAKKLRELTWFEFENLVKQSLKNTGYDIFFSASKGVGDGGIDVVATKKSKVLETWIIQCKHWKEPVGPDVLRELVGSMQDYMKIEKTSPEASVRGAVYTTSYFTPEALEYSERHDISIFDGEAWQKLDS